MMIAVRESRCRICGAAIETGEEIAPIGKHSWGHPDCVEQAQRR